MSSDFFLDLLNRARSPDQAISKDAVVALKDLRSQNEPLFINSLCDSIESKQSGLCEFSAILLTNTINYVQIYDLQLNRRLKEIRKYWYSEEFFPIYSHLETVIFNEIHSSNPTMRNIVSRILALIIGISGENISASQKLIGFISSIDVSNQTEIAIISSVTEICQFIITNRNFGNDISPSFFNTVIGYLSSYLRQKPPIQTCPDTIIAILQALVFLIRIHSDYFEVEDNIKNLLESISLYFPMPNLRVYQLCHDLMFELISAEYAKAPSFFGIIASFAFTGIQMANFEYSSISLLFWKEIFDFENQQKENGSSINLLDNQKIEQSLLPVLFSIMDKCTSITPNDYDDMSPLSASKDAIESLLLAVPRLSYQYISFLFSRLDQSNEHQLFDFILYLHASMNPSVAYFSIDGNCTAQFVCQNIPLILNAASQETNVLLKLAALDFLIKMQTVIPDLFQSDSYNYGMLFDLMVMDNVHPILIERYFHLINVMCISFKGDFHLFSESVKSKLLQIWSMPGLLLILPLNSAVLLAQNKFAISIKVSNAQFAVGFLSELISLVNNETATGKESEARRLSIINMIGGICSRVPEVIDKDKASQVTSFLIGEVNQTHSPEATFSLALALDMFIKNTFPNQLMQGILDILANTIGSENPQLMIAGCQLMRHLFSNANNEQRHSIMNGAFELITSRVFNNPSFRQVWPAGVAALASTIDWIATQGDVSDIAQYREPFQNIISMLLSQPNSLSATDQENMGELFPKLAVAFETYGKVFYQPGTPNERNQLMMMISFLKQILPYEAIRNKAYPNVLRMIYEFGCRVSKRNNVLIRRREISEFMRLFGSFLRYSNKMNMGEARITEIKGWYAKVESTLVNV